MANVIYSCALSIDKQDGHYYRLYVHQNSNVFYVRTSMEKNKMG